MNDKVLYEIKLELENIGQSLYHLSKDINTLVKQILKESKKDDEKRI